MPIYEYVCKGCGAQLEIMHKISEQPSEPCLACGSHDLERLVSAAGFRLKGGGWYETDFKSGNKRNLAAESGEAKPAGDKAEKPVVDGAAKPEKSGGAGASAKSEPGPSSAAA